MKFEISLAKENIITLMRRCAYVPDGQDEKRGELRFFRRLAGTDFPRFHVYCQILFKEDKAILNLHLDQKQPTYQGVHAHSGEYEGLLIKKEAERIKGT